MMDLCDGKDLCGSKWRHDVVPAQAEFLRGLGVLFENFQISWYCEINILIYLDNFLQKLFG